MRLGGSQYFTCKPEGHEIESYINRNSPVQRITTNSQHAYSSAIRSSSEGVPIKTLRDFVNERDIDSAVERMDADRNTLEVSSLIAFTTNPTQTLTLLYITRISLTVPFHTLNIYSSTSALSTHPCHRHSICHPSRPTLPNTQSLYRLHCSKRRFRRPLRLPHRQQSENRSQSLLTAEYLTAKRSRPAEESRYPLVDPPFLLHLHGSLWGVRPSIQQM